MPRSALTPELRPALPTGLGSVRMLKNPVRFGSDEIVYRRPPGLGEDTDDVLRTVLGLSAGEIERLHERHAVGSPAGDHD